MSCAFNIFYIFTIHRYIMGNKFYLEHPIFQKGVELEKQHQFLTALKVYQGLTNQETKGAPLWLESHLKIAEIAADFSQLDVAQASVELLQNYLLSAIQTVRLFICQSLMFSKKGALTERFQYTCKALEYCEKHLDKCKSLLPFCLYRRGFWGPWVEMKEWANKALEVIHYTPFVEDQVLCYAFTGHSNYTDLSIALKWFNKAEALAKESLPFPEYLISVINIFKCRVYQFLGQHLQANECCLIAESCYLNSKVDFPLNYASTTYRFMAFNYMNSRELYESILYGHKALVIEERTLKEGLPFSYNALANAYALAGDFEQAVFYVEKGFATLKKQKDWDNEKNFYLHTVYRNLADIYRNTNSRKQAVSFYEKALSILVKQEADLITYTGIWERLAELNPNEKGLEYAKLSLKHCSKEGRFIVLQTVGVSYLNLGKLDLALDCFFKALSDNLYHQSFNIKNENLFYQFESFDDAIFVLFNIGKIYYIQYEQSENLFKLREAVTYFDYAFNMGKTIQYQYSEQSQIILMMYTSINTHGI